MNLNDFELPDHLTAFIFQRKKDAEQKTVEHGQDQYEVVAIHIDKSNVRYQMFVTYVMPLDTLIEFIRSTQYKIVTIKELR